MNKCQPGRLAIWGAILILAALVGISWLSSAIEAEARDGAPACDSSGDDNDLLNCIWTVEQRFGGFYVDSTNPSVVQVWLTGDRASEDAERRVLAEINRLWGRDFSATTAHEADYTIAQLKRWFDLVVSDPGESIRAVDLDESANLLALYGPDLEDATVAAIKDHATSLGVPAEALSVKQVDADLEPPTPDPIPGARRSSDATEPAVPIGAQRVNRALNPFVGGAEIKGGGVACTATMTVAFVNEDGDDESGFITGDHCGVVSTTWRAYGTGSTGDRKVGVTARTAKGGNRNIDIAYANWDSPEGVELGVGFIARPVEENTAKKGATKTQLSLDPDYPYFEVAGIRRPVSGETVHKVGRSSGWTSGEIRGTCVAQVSIGNPAQPVCSADGFSMHIMAGDSGSPVFAIEADGRVSILSIVSGYFSGHRIGPALEVMFHSQGIDQVRVTPNDYDADDDRLIEVSNLAQLNAIRWDPDGDGSSGNSNYTEAYPLAQSAMGCPASGCRGYELAADLNLDTDGDGGVDSDDDYWNDGAGWQPIGSSSNRFDAIFDGNGYTIYNLFIDRGLARYVGLFGFTNSSTVIRNADLRATDIRGDAYVGSLVGAMSYGAVFGSRAAGEVAGFDYAGGLVGASFNGLISASYSTARVSGDDHVGGLVGWNGSGRIVAAYATGTVSGDQYVGGLVGYQNRGSITASYATGTVSGNDHIGGLAGGGNQGATTDSYWDTQSSGQSSSSGGAGKTTARLQENTDYAGIFANWRVDADNADRDQDAATGRDDPWDFGSSTNYPALKAFKVPTAPASLTATPDNASLVLKWSTADGQEGVITRHQYRLEGGEWTDISHSAYGQANSASWAVSGLDNGTTYTVRVRAMNGVWFGPASNAVVAIPRTTPGPPIISLMNGTTDGMALAWSPPVADGGDGVTGYDLRYILISDDASADSNWTQVDEVWSSGDLAYTVSGLTEGWQYEAQVRAVNAVGEGPWSAPAKDRDADDDGLIEIDSLAELHAVRWDLNGDGKIEEPDYVDEFSSRGCPPDGACIGYELTTDLDLDTNGNGMADSSDTYWNDGAGWETIGSGAPVYNFNAVFEVNGHTISNLFINRTGIQAWEVGLFGQIGLQGTVKNLGLPSVDVTGAYDVGGLAGANTGAITNVYVTGSVASTGRFFGNAGGLVGNSGGRIAASYFSGDVAGNNTAGGLVGAFGNQIIASYATGTVTAEHISGGLTGTNFGAITASYATGKVDSDETAGGLTAIAFRTTVDSYWDTDTSGQSSSDGGVGKTTAELQSPLEYFGIYAEWEVDVDDADGDGDPATGGDAPWDFGGDLQYPALSVDFNGDGVATWQEFGNQRAFTVPGSPENFDVAASDQTVALTWTPAPDNGSPITEYHYQILEGDTQASKTWTTVADGAETTTATIFDLTNGTRYRFRVRARNGAGNGVPSPWVEVTPAPPPSAPGNLTASPGDGWIRLEWTPAVSDYVPVLKHQFQQKSDPPEFGDWIDIPASGSEAENSTSFTVASLNNGTEYTHRVRAVNGSGAGTASDSTTATAGAPAQPSGLGWAPGDGQITLTWDNPVDDSITGYQYQQDGGAWTDIPASDAGTTDHTVASLTDGTVYAFNIKAVNTHGAGPDSDAVVAIPGTPAKPTGIAIAVSANEATLSWADPGDSSITGYQYRKSDDAGDTWSPDWKAIPGSDATSRSHTVTGLASDTAYVFQVHANNGHGSGPPSEAVKTSVSLQLYLERLDNGRYFTATESLRTWPSEVNSRENTHDMLAAHLMNVSDVDVYLEAATVTIISGPGMADVSDFRNLGASNSFQWFRLATPARSGLPIQPLPEAAAPSIGASSSNPKNGSWHEAYWKIADDRTLEGSEQVHMRLDYVLTDGSVGTFTTDGLTLEDDDSATVSVSDVTVNEDGGTADVQVKVEVNDGDGRVGSGDWGNDGPNSRPQQLAFPVTVDWITSDGTALAGEDYTAASATLTLDGTDLEQILAVVLVNDEVVEAEEAFGLTISNLTLSAQSDAAITIDDANATVTIVDASGDATAVHISASNVDPSLGDSVTLTAVVVNQPDGAPTYQWQRQSSGDWRDVPGAGETKTVKFDSSCTRTYRVQVTYAGSEPITSDAVSLTW